jgi:hypothetical protein
MTFKNFMRELNGDDVEGEIIKTMFYSLVTSIIILAILYYFKFQYIENFISNYGFYLFFSALSIAFIIPSLRHVRAYKEFPCMTGMMIGMTIGMVSGFLLGFYSAATNGMFYGSVLGMAVGIYLGISNGKCCGVMGVMEGIMAGFMGGLMGAMTAVMMINDNIKLAGIIVFIICATILFGLHYLIYTETREFERRHKDDNFYTIWITFILISLTTWLIIYGPRSTLFGG